MMASHLVKVQIARPVEEVYLFLAEPRNFPEWAGNPGSAAVPIGGRDWLVEVPRGRLVVRFSPPNAYGVLDYATFPEGETSGPVTPVRVYANGKGTEMVLTWMQRPGTSDEQFASDIAWIESDLQRLKSLLEIGT